MNSPFDPNLHKMCINELKDLGAKVTDIDQVLTFVEFKKNGLEVSYLYGITSENENVFFLEKTKPYHLPLGDFIDENIIMEQIKTDLDKIQNAKNSHKFDSFLDTLKKLKSFKEEYDDLFLSYNISTSDMQYIYNNIVNLCDSVYEVQARSQRIYPETNCDRLKNE